MALCGGIVLEETLDMSFDRLLMMMMMMMLLQGDTAGSYCSKLLLGE